MKLTNTFPELQKQVDQINEARNKMTMKTYNAGGQFLLFIEFQGKRYFNSLHSHYDQAAMAGNAIFNEHDGAQLYIADRSMDCHGERDDFDKHYAEHNK